MNWQPLTFTLKTASGMMTIVRPGITLWLTYAQPLPQLGPAVATIIERYLAFIPPGSLEHYLAANGTYKQFSPRFWNDTLKRLRSVPEQTEFLTIHVGQGPYGTVGSHGIHFMGSNLDHADSTPLETSLLLLEFPPTQLELTPPDAFVQFALEIAGLAEINSGVGGYAFKHPQMHLRAEAIEQVAKTALRYIGLDISYDSIQLDLKGHVHNASWLTFLGKKVLRKLGGPDTVRKALPPQMKIYPLAAEGLVVQAAAQPMIGDVNRGATDVAPLRKVAALVRPVRVETDYLGSDNALFAERWLTRLDERPAGPDEEK